MIWTAGKESLLKFIETINKAHPSIKFEVKYSKTTINFLDCNVHLSPTGQITTTLYKKPTDRNAYLHYTSYHPHKQVENIPFGQFLRARKICSDPKDAISAMNDIEHKFHLRGYPKSKTAAQKIKSTTVPREALLTDKPKTQSRRTPFTTTYNQGLPPINKIINKHWEILQTHSKIARSFTERLVLAFRRNRNLRNLRNPLIPG